MKNKLLLFLLFSFNLFAFPQKWTPIYEGSKIMYDAKYKHKDVEWKLNNDNILKVDDWNSYLKNYVFSYPVESRDSIVDGLTRLYTNIDKVDKVLRFEPVRYFSGYYANNSYISFLGVIDKKQIHPYIKFMYRSIDWIFIESVKIVTDNNSYEFNVSDCHRQTVGRGMTAIAESFVIDYNETMIIDIINSKESIVRFIGKNGYDDYIVTDKIKNDLLAFYKTIMAIRNNQ